MIKLKRIYEGWDEEDGFRILVDRLWPRGVKKGEAKIDLWLKEIAPSPELRRWFNHEVEKWTTFSEKYREELKSKMELVKKVIAIEKEHGVITFVYSAKDLEHNHAFVLKEVIEEAKTFPIL